MWTGQESKAGRVRPPAAGYITILPGPEMRACHECMDIARVFLDVCIRLRGPILWGPMSPMISRWAPFVLDLGPQLAPWALAGD